MEAQSRKGSWVFSVCLLGGISKFSVFEKYFPISSEDLLSSYQNLLMKKTDKFFSCPIEIESEIPSSQTKCSDRQLGNLVRKFIGNISLQRTRYAISWPIIRNTIVEKKNHGEVA